MKVGCSCAPICSQQQQQFYNTHDLWLVGRLHFSALKLVPVKALEEHVPFDVLLSGLRVAAQAA